MTTAPTVEDRRELFEYYEGVCSHSYARLRSDQMLELEQNLLKSYLLEIHIDDGFRDESLDAPSSGRAYHFLTSLFQPWKAEVIPAEDGYLFNVRQGKEVVHVDTWNTRFWVLHASSPANWTDRLVDRLTRHSTAVDVAWFHSDAMVDLSKRGRFLGFSSEYDPRPLGESSLRDRPPGLILNFRRFSGDAASDLEKLRMPGMFSDQIGVSSIKVRFGEDGPQDFSLTDITHSGKFTERGPSFSAHTALIRAAISSYESRVEQIESAFGISWERSGRAQHVSGSTICISFRPYVEFDYVISRIFDGGKPFRLWGHPYSNGDGSYSVQAVDLHVGSLLRFDVSNGYIRVYLPHGACGNTVTRLLTNLQRHVDAQAFIVAAET